MSRIKMNGVEIPKINKKAKRNVTLYMEGAGGGTSSYSNLEDKPTLNGVTLEGNMVSNDLALPKVVIVDNMELIDEETIESLNTGDIVIQYDDVIDRGFEYVVQFKDETGVVFIYMSEYGMGSVHYFKYNDHWSFLNRRTIPLTIDVDDSLPIDGMISNTVYNLGELDSTTTFTLATPTDILVANVWIWTFSTGATVPQLNFPNVTWFDNTNTETVGNDVIPVIEANKYYEVTIMNGYGTVLSADV